MLSASRTAMLLAFQLTLTLALQGDDPILPTDPRLVTIGRFLKTRNGASCQWSGSEVRMRVEGGQLVARIDDSGRNHVQVVVDGQATQVLALRQGEHSYTVNVPAGEHEIRLIRRTEASFGTTTYKGFSALGGTWKRAKARSRRLEVIGDSITCGFGNEGQHQSEPFKAETENAWLTYGMLAAEAVQADVTLIAWSGRKMWPDNTIPSIYDRILPTEASSIYDFKDPVPDAYVINLATNDFGKENPEEKPWTDAYAAFVKRLQERAPRAQIYAAVGSMMSDNYPVGHQALSTLRGYLSRLEKRLGDPKFRVIEFETQRMEDGIGSAWHPNLVTHRKMAAVLTQHLKADLKW